MVFGEFSLQILCGLGLPNLGRCPDSFDKLGLIGNGVGADRPDGVQQQRPDVLGTDVMPKALLLGVAKCQGISRAIVVVVGIEAAHWVFAAIFFAGLRSATVVIHFRPAVGTIEQASQRISNAGGVCAPYCLAQPLSQFPGFRVNDGLMGVLDPCVDKRDAAQKHRDKVKQCAENPKIIANKRRKKLDISKQPPVSKNLRTKDAKSAIYGRSKLAIHLPPK